MSNFVHENFWIRFLMAGFDFIFGEMSNWLGDYIAFLTVDFFSQDL